MRVIRDELGNVLEATCYTWHSGNVFQLLQDGPGKLACVHLIQALCIEQHHISPAPTLIPNQDGKPCPVYRKMLKVGAGEVLHHFLEHHLDGLYGHSQHVLVVNC